MNPRQRYAMLDVYMRARFQRTEEQASRDGSVAMRPSQLKANANWGFGPDQGAQVMAVSRPPLERPSFCCSMGPSGEQLL